MSLRLDVARQEVLVRRRRERERVVLGGFERGAVKPHPLAGQILEVGWPVELNLEHVGRQQLRLQDVQCHVLGAQADHFVQNEYDTGPDEVFPELWRPCDSSQSVQ